MVRSSRVIPTWDGRTARLEIENLELEDAGLYTCVAENEVGRTRCSARLMVLEKGDPSQEDRRPPVFLQELPAEMVATDGDMLDLQVRLEGGCTAESQSFGVLQCVIRCTAESHSVYCRQSVIRCTAGSHSVYCSHSLYCRQPLAVLQAATRCTTGSHSLYYRQPLAVLQTATQYTLCLQMCCSFIKNKLLSSYVFSLHFIIFAGVSKVTRIKQVFCVANGLGCS